jgi:hypothetical protein
VSSKKSKPVILTHGELVSRAPVREKFPDRKRGWSVEHHGKNIHVIKVPRPSCKNVEQWVLLLADNHIDNPAARNDVLTKLLAQAVERDAVTIIVGDFLDLMQGRNDRRSNKSALRSALLTDAYFDRVVDMGADLLAPYASHIAVLAAGNHETGWLRHNESDPTAHVVRAVKERAHSPIGAGGYGGWIKFQVQGGHANMSYTMRYQHGTGGGNAFASMGLLDARRMYSWIEGADTIVISHNHASNVAGIAREYLSSQNGQYRVETRHCDFIRVGTTKASWEKSQGAAGWEVEKGFGPQPIRQKWLRLYVTWETDDNKRGKPRLAWEVHDAQ